MAIWLIIIAIVVVLLTVLAVLRKSKVSSIENFQDTSGSASATVGNPPIIATLADFLSSVSGGVQPPSLNKATSQFIAYEQNYLENVLGKEVMTNSAMPDYSNVMDPAVNQPDVYLNSPEKIIVQNLQTDNNSKYSDADIQFCRSAKMPENLPRHVKRAIVGCGWYYIPDPNMTSSGALGQADGPLFPKGLNDDGVNGIPNYGNGQWIWDLELAQQLEAIKNCARIKTCIGIDAPSVNGACGFCASSGRGIPTHADGTEKYPNSLTVGKITAPAAMCDTPPIMNGASCNTTPAKPLVTAKGVNCGTFGYPSPDFSIRLYSQNDCVNNMNGNWVPNGECLIQGGGSYSDVCKPLNGIKPAPPGPTLCTPDINGKISNACLISLAQGVGLTSQGSIVQMLKSGKAPGQFDKVAIQIMKGENVAINPVLYTGGIISVGDAVAGYDAIYNMIKTGSTPIVQQAAMWLCIGTTGFDPCNLPDNTPGPFFDQCVQQQWRIAGCQPAGTNYPSEPETIGQLNTLTWGNVKALFQNTYNAMTKTDDPVQQDIAVMRCLGITTQRSSSPPCVGITRDGLVLNLDSAALADPSVKADYTTNGKWTSVNAMYVGSAIASGTRVADKYGIQLDGTTVLGTPNLVNQVLGLPASNVVNGPASDTIRSTYTSKWASFPAAMYGPAIADRSTKVPIARFDQDNQGNKVYIISDGGYTKMINSQNECKYTSDSVESYRSSLWSQYWPASPGAYILYMAPPFDASRPIFASGEVPLKDIGYPGEGMGIAGNQKTNYSVVYTMGPAQWQAPEDGKWTTLLAYMNASVTNNASNSQSLVVTIRSNNNLVWSAPITYVGLTTFWSNPWGGIIGGSVPGPVHPYGSYYNPPGTNLPPFEEWNKATSATMTIGIATKYAETRELWINPNVDTCEILAVLNGPSFAQSYTAMALYKGQLVIALQSNEKGYTFFNAGVIPSGQWSHVVHVYDQGNHSVYINGIGPVSMGGLTPRNTMGYIGYSLGGGSSVNPLYKKVPSEMPFQGGIGAFRVYNRALSDTEIRNNLGATVNLYNNQVQLAIKNDPNAIAMASGKFYVPSLANSINYQANPST
jgi:Concanavalin A-like lectin/glucanases superfamily